MKQLWADRFFQFFTFQIDYQMILYLNSNSFIFLYVCVSVGMDGRTKEVDVSGGNLHRRGHQITAARGGQEV